jgi:hypothetical protein
MGVGERVENPTTGQMTIAPTEDFDHLERYPPDCEKTRNRLHELVEVMDDAWGFLQEMPPGRVRVLVRPTEEDKKRGESSVQTNDSKRLSAWFWFAVSDKVWGWHCPWSRKTAAPSVRAVGRNRKYARKRICARAAVAVQTEADEAKELTHISMAPVLAWPAHISRPHGRSHANSHYLGDDRCGAGSPIEV